MPYLIPELPVPLVFTIDPEKPDELVPKECNWRPTPEGLTWLKNQKGLYRRETQVFRIQPEILWRDKLNYELSRADTANPWASATSLDALGFLKDHGNDPRFNYPIVVTGESFKMSTQMGELEGYLGLGRGGAKEYRGLRLFAWADGYHGPLCRVLGVRAVPTSP